MNAINWKKLLLPNIPYLFFVYLFDKVGQAVRLSPGADLSGKVLSLGEGFSMAFATPLPSLAPMDLLIGIFGALLIRLIVYVKGKNAKKYRKGVEYGSARWGTAEDIRPYTDPVFQNNVLLTQTERLTMTASSGRYCSMRSKSSSNNSRYSGLSISTTGMEHVSTVKYRSSSFSRKPAMSLISPIICHNSPCGSPSPALSIYSASHVHLLTMDIFSPSGSTVGSMLSLRVFPI